MIEKLGNSLKVALEYIKNHPQLLFILVLLLLLPLLFLYTGQQFLDAGRQNQDRLQKDKIGLMHDAFASLLSATNFNQDIAKTELQKIASQNPDIVDYKLAIEKKGKIIPLIARNEKDLDIPVKEDSLYISSGLRTDESLIFEYSDNAIRTWDTYRAIRSENDDVYFLYTKVSLGNIDRLFLSREHKAYYSLFFVYLFVIALAYFHIRLTDYRYLYLKAEKESGLKDLFSNMITHELRTPLTAIKGYAGILAEKVAGTEEKIQAKRIEESADRLIEIVNDLLDVASIQSGKLSIIKNVVDLSVVIQKVQSDLSIIANQKNIRLLTEGLETPHLISTDNKRLNQALINVISNAIKYTPDGDITTSVTEVRNHFEIRIKDTGMGISHDDQQKLFAPFFRVESADVSKITGTGLGMWITKEIIELMGGKIGVESIKGVGTHVVISFPKISKLN